MRGEWIEMYRREGLAVPALSLPMRGEWIEISLKNAALPLYKRSLPMRGEWIEIEFGGIII